mgnify:CR=1 FL=1
MQIYLHSRHTGHDIASNEEYLTHSLTQSLTHAFFALSAIVSPMVHLISAHWTGRARQQLNVSVRVGVGGGLVPHFTQRPQLGGVERGHSCGRIAQHSTASTANVASTANTGRPAHDMTRQHRTAHDIRQRGEN